MAGMVRIMLCISDLNGIMSHTIYKTGAKEEVVVRETDFEKHKNGLAEVLNKLVESEGADVTIIGTVLAAHELDFDIPRQIKINMGTGQVEKLLPYPLEQASALYKAISDWHNLYQAYKDTDSLFPQS